jgi:EpsI family protein
MNSTVTRLIVVVMLLAVMSGGTYLVRASLKPPKVQMPDKDFAQLPLQLGGWQGKNVDLDPKIFETIGADLIVNRSYRDTAQHVISAHLAVFTDPDTGVYHSPMNCYRSDGWQKGSEDVLQLRLGDQPGIEGNLTTWEKGGRAVVVLYWYQVGEHVLFDRFDMGRVRWALRGQETWPALVKVLMETQGSGDLDRDKARLRDLAERVYQWINQPAGEPAFQRPAE